MDGLGGRAAILSCTRFSELGRRLNLVYKFVAEVPPSHSVVYYLASHGDVQKLYHWALARAIRLAVFLGEDPFLFLAILVCILL